MDQDPSNHRDETSSSTAATRNVAIGMAATFAVVGICVGVALYSNPGVVSQFKAPTGIAGSITQLPEARSAEAKLDPSMGDEFEEYVPSSAYIEEGADNRNLEFGFGEGATGSEVLSDGMIQNVVTRGQNDLIGCYAEQLQENQELEGQVFFEFAVRPNGRVAMVKVTDSSLRSKEAEDCFVEKARRWQFPAVDSDILTRFDTDFMFSWR